MPHSSEKLGILSGWMSVGKRKYAVDCYSLGVWVKHFKKLF